MRFLSKLKDAMFGKSEPSMTPSGKVDVVDISKVARTGILMGLATFMTHMLANVKPDMFGEHEATAAIILTIVSELALRFMKDNK